MGILFRSERERKGLNYEQIYEMTRLRPTTLEALENEDWDNLPSPVFVTGFIRSYARALGLEEKKAVRLYEKVAPVVGELPEPPVGPIRTRRNFPVFFTFLLFALVFAYYLREEYSSRKGGLTNPETIGPVVDNSVEPENTQETPNQIELMPLNRRNEMNLAPETENGIIITEINGDSLVQENGSPSPSEEKSTPGSETDSGIETQELILSAHVREGTWIRIYVDDQDPKEYILRPGSQPQWRAKKGFELLIGNAGGIGLEFGGKRIESLGGLGQVVRLKLPENYERGNLQD
jgi:cytoskeleton protein RodZ